MRRSLSAVFGTFPSGSVLGYLKLFDGSLLLDLEHQVVLVGGLDGLVVGEVDAEPPPLAVVGAAPLGVGPDPLARVALEKGPLAEALDRRLLAQSPGDGDRV